MAVPTFVTRHRSALLIVLGCLLVGLEAAHLFFWSTKSGLDLRVYRAGAGAWLSGHDPYARRLTRFSLWYTYPPASLLVLSFLNVLSFAWTRVLWWLVTLGAIGGSIWIVLRTQGATWNRRTAGLVVVGTCAAALVLEPVRSSLYAGQINPLLLLAVLVDLFVMPRRFRGLLLGVAAAVKLTPLAFVLYLVLRREWSSVGRSLAAFAGVTGLAWAIAPQVSASYWVHDALATGRVGQVGFSDNVALYGLLNRTTSSHSLAVGLWIAGSLVALCCAVQIARRAIAVGEDVLALLAIAICGLLVSPISWSHHWVWLVLVPVLLLPGARAGVPPPVRNLLWGGVALAVACPYWWGATSPAGRIGGDLFVAWFAGLLVVWSVTVRERGPQGLSRRLRRRAAALVGHVRRAPVPS